MNPLTWRHSQRERASITELVDAVFDRQDTLLDLSRRDLADIPDELLDLRNFVAIPIPSPDDVVEDAEADPSQALAFPAVPLGHPGAVAPMAQTATLRPAPSSASTRPELLQRLPSIDHEQGLALDLSSNAITHLPPAFFDLRLRTIWRDHYGFRRYRVLGKRRAEDRNTAAATLEPELGALRVIAADAPFEKEQQQQQQQRSQVQPGPATPATADLQSHLEAPPPIPTASAAPAIPL
ncbi:hypothetical protein CXG81DRAFT_27286 [Caulochytrium protostelioides]|uniref:Uncharacterized protein n=1 Tax=Caulochytrium protostelioides TaxID=1555241 RepID=A0A4V1IUB4_9FUNG|nr:hypothetical protein CXG81DRAFT_27286 [Caulochytrium protostelioides]|eukprot:RKO99968.1 hypothetical protein CXG81DRAFT_27286 [Caulochytrium protostelioides]